VRRGWGREEGLMKGHLTCQLWDEKGGRGRGGGYLVKKLSLSINPPFFTDTVLYTLKK
jgi:hypothetical protein